MQGERVFGMALWRLYAVSHGSRILVTWRHASSPTSSWMGTVVAQHKRYADVSYTDANANPAGKHRFPPPKSHDIDVTRLAVRKPQHPILPPPVGALVGRRIALRFRPSFACCTTDA
eukprot:PhM_4_TR15644/c2_g2_i1/m.6816